MHAKCDNSSFCRRHFVLFNILLSLNGLASSASSLLMCLVIRSMVQLEKWTRVATKRKIVCLVYMERHNDLAHHNKKRIQMDQCPETRSIYPSCHFVLVTKQCLTWNGLTNCVGTLLDAVLYKEAAIKQKCPATNVKISNYL